MNPIAASFANAPICFKRSKKAAHLFDLDTERLKRTARRLGIRVIFVDRAGTDRQHIDVCGMPLERALAECNLETLPGLEG